MFVRRRMRKIAKEQQAAAEKNARIADSGRLVAEARTALANHPQRSLILAVEAVKATRDHNEPVMPAAQTMLQEGLSNVGGKPLIGHEGPINALVFASDGRLVTAGSDGTARVWDLKNPQAEPLVLRGHEGPISALVFASDGRLVTAGSDGTARVWDLKQPAGRAPGPAGTRGRDQRPGFRVRRPAGHRGLRRDRAGLEAPTAGLTDIDRLIERAKLAAGRDLTRAEWEQYFRGKPYRKTFSGSPAAPSQGP